MNPSISLHRDQQSNAMMLSKAVNFLKKEEDDDEEENVLRSESFHPTPALGHPNTRYQHLHQGFLRNARRTEEASMASGSYGRTERDEVLNGGGFVGRTSYSCASDFDSVSDGSHLSSPRVAAILSPRSSQSRTHPIGVCESKPIIMPRSRVSSIAERTCASRSGSMGHATNGQLDAPATSEPYEATYPVSEEGIGRCRLYGSSNLPRMVGIETKKATFQCAPEERSVSRTVVASTSDFIPREHRETAGEPLQCSGVRDSQGSLKWGRSQRSRRTSRSDARLSQAHSLLTLESTREFSGGHGSNLEESQDRPVKEYRATTVVPARPPSSAQLTAATTATTAATTDSEEGYSNAAKGIKNRELKDMRRPGQQDLSFRGQGASSKQQLESLQEPEQSITEPRARTVIQTSGDVVVATKGRRGTHRSRDGSCEYTRDSIALPRAASSPPVIERPAAASARDPSARGRRRTGVLGTLDTGSAESVERRPNNFRYAREVGKFICVCGASAYWERERVALAQERQRIKQETQKLRQEVQTMREAREKFHARLVDLEEMDTIVKSRTEVVLAREAATEEETRRLTAVQEEMKRSRLEIEKDNELLLQREKEIEIKRRKLEREAAETAEKEKKLAVEAQKLCEATSQLARREIEILNAETALAELETTVNQARRTLAKDMQFVAEEKMKLADTEKRLEKLERELIGRETECACRFDELERKTNEFNAKLSAQREESQKLQKRESILEEKHQALEERKKDIDDQQQRLEADMRSFQNAQEKDDREWKDRIDRERKELQKLLDTADRRQRCNDEKQAALDAQEANVAEKLKRCGDLEIKLSMRSRELDAKERELTERDTSLQHIQESIDRDRHALEENRAHLEKQAGRLEAQEAEFHKLRETEAKKQSAFYAQVTQLEKARAALAEKEAAINRRDAALLSKEAQSEWHQEILKDIADVKDRYELQLQDFELEKRAFAEMKAEVLAVQERTANALRNREQSLAALEATVRTRQTSVARREKALEMRLRHIDSVKIQAPSSLHHASDVHCQAPLTINKQRRGPRALSPLSSTTERTISRCSSLQKRQDLYQKEESHRQAASLCENMPSNKKQQPAFELRHNTAPTTRITKSKEMSYLGDPHTLLPSMSGDRISSSCLSKQDRGARHSLHQSPVATGSLAENEPPLFTEPPLHTRRASTHEWLPRLPPDLPELSEPLRTQNLPDISDYSRDPVFSTTTDSGSSAITDLSKNWSIDVVNSSRPQQCERVPRINSSVSPEALLWRRRPRGSSATVRNWETGDVSTKAKTDSLQKLISLHESPSPSSRSAVSCLPSPAFISNPPVESFQKSPASAINLTARNVARPDSTEDLYTKGKKNLGSASHCSMEPSCLSPVSASACFSPLAPARESLCSTERSIRSDVDHPQSEQSHSKVALHQMPTDPGSSSDPTLLGRVSSDHPEAPTKASAHDSFPDNVSHLTKLCVESANGVQNGVLFENPPSPTQQQSFYVTENQDDHPQSASHHRSSITSSRHGEASSSPKCGSSTDNNTNNSDSHRALTNTEKDTHYADPVRLAIRRFPVRTFESLLAADAGGLDFSLKTLDSPLFTNNHRTLDNETESCCQPES